MTGDREAWTSQRQLLLDIEYQPPRAAVQSARGIFSRKTNQLKRYEDMAMRTDHPNCNPNGHYGMGEAAKALGINRRTLYNYTRRLNSPLKLRANKATGRMFILGKDINAFWAREL